MGISMPETLRVSAVIVTRGDVDLSRQIEYLSFMDEVLVWDNSDGCDAKVYGRYLATRNARNPVIFTIDDDCLVDAKAVIDAYVPGTVVVNMTAAKRSEYEILAPGVALVGWGSVFEAKLVSVLDQYLGRYPKDDIFFRECDRVFTGLNSIQYVDTPVEHMTHASSGRMGNESRHLIDLAEICKRIEIIKRGNSLPRL